MKKLIALAIAATFSVGCFAAEPAADESLIKMGVKDGRSFHEMNYESGCDSCHDNGIRVRPSDDACEACHDVDDLAEATTREGEEALQNPHDNLHYGKETPCTECHGEHEAKAPLCSECHTFKFDAHKR